MAKQDKVTPTRKQREEESLLLRSAESLGRMIGTLQRQLDGASRSMASATDDVVGALASGNGIAVPSRRAPTRKAVKSAKPAARGKTSAKAKTGATKATAASKRAAAPTAAPTSKTKSTTTARSKNATARKSPRGR